MMKNLHLTYKGYDKALDNQIETAIEEQGGAFSYCGYSFVDKTRDIGFDIPAEKEDAIKKILDGMGGIEYAVTEQ
jgi:hypothetical protein